MYIAIGAAVLVVLAVLAVIVTARKQDTRRGEGALSRETLKRDRSEAVEGSLSGKAYERSAVAGGSALATVDAPAGSTDLVKVGAQAPVAWTPPDAEELGVTRRHFFNLGLISLMGVGLGGFGAACIAFLWPKLGGGFGSKINAGKLEEVEANIKSNKGFYYLAEGRAWITEYPAVALPNAAKIYKPGVLAGMQAGVVALYQKCPHLGCRVPNCTTSQWFECPCHGSQYNRVGEKKGGPAPRGMDRFSVSIVNNNVIINTGDISLGPAIGTNTTGQEAEGPHCVGGGEHKA
jgi:cytochrome b6-f complex iron-sulfur subunit